MMNLTRPLAALALTLALVTTFPPSPALAQEPEAAPAEGEGSGRSLDGYFATGALVGLALFLVCKSARRS
jgi:hypothetical protein